MIEAWATIQDGQVGCGGHNGNVPWWSFTKTVLAAAALVLVRDGRVGLDEPVQGKPYTLRHLLQHRSGLADYGEIPAYHEAVARNDEPWSVSALLDNVDARRLRYPAGERWEYSNVGYLLVRQLIEATVRESLDQALQRLVLKPLGVKGARVALERGGLDDVSMGSAEGYHPGWVYHGLLVGPVPQAALLLDGLMSGCLLPSEQLQAMLTPFVLRGPIPGRPWVSPGYGLGLMIGEVSNGKRVAGHTGGGPGSTIGVYCSLDEGRRRTAAFFAASEDQSRTENEAFRLLQ